MQNLEKIEHIVILMMENRSFDQMLGYLALEGHPVNGLRKGMTNSWGGRPYRVERLKDFSVEVGPGHSHEDVLQQMGLDESTTPTMTGFVRNYAGRLLGTRRLPDVMGYYTGEDLPVYDLLAREFCICDRWFSPVPGPTWPNRFFAYAGHSAGKLKNEPPAQLKTIFDVLDTANVTWQYYSHDIAFIRTLPQFRRLGAGQGISKIGAFARALKSETLPAVSWIDPNFTLQEAVFHFGYSNDDHPPADVRRGQNLVARVYNAIRQSAYWEKSLFVVVYDEHGGFFDHEPPPAAISPDGTPAFRQFGPRVPALLVSPWVARGAVDSTLRDHTTLVKTILNRFVVGTAAGVVDLGARVSEAPDIGNALSESAPRAGCPNAREMDVSDFSAGNLFFRRAKQGEDAVGPRRFGELQATEMQEEMLTLAAELRAAGVAEGDL
jgi:phospholipase C